MNLEHDAGSTRWSRDTYTIHQVTFTLTDDAMAAVTDDDTLRIGLQSREGFTLVTLTPNQLRRLLHGDPRARKDSA